MSTRCEGMNATDTAACEDCHRRGYTWVIRPDGSMICSEAARFDPDGGGTGSSSGGSGTALLVGILGLLGAVVVGTRV